MATGPAFPAFLKLEHQRDGSAKASFLAEMAQIAGDAQRQFQRSFDEVGRTIDRSLSGFKNGSYNFSVDIGGLRQAAADADFALQRMSALRDAAVRLARETGDTSQSTRTYLSALRAQVIEADRAKASADAQVTTYARLQTEIDRTIASNNRLAQSYRETFAEQARASNAAFANQQEINSRFGLGRTGDDTYGFTPGKSARDSAATFENYGYKSSVDTRSGVDRLRDGAASLDRAAVAATTLDSVLGRVAQKGTAVADAMREAERATESQAQAAAKAAQERAVAEAKASADRERLVGATNALRQSLDPTIAVQQRFNSAMDVADRAFEQGVLGAQEYARIQQSLRTELQQSYSAIASGASAQEKAVRQGTTANHMMVNSQRSLRLASVQTGQQLQDIAISLYGGQQATVVFAQQLPQLAFALSGLEGSANKTHDRIGRFATFLSGPWGLAVGLAVGGAAMLLSELIKMGDESDKAKDKVFDFSGSLNVLELSAKNSATAMGQLADATRSAIAVQGDFLANQSAIAEKSVADIEARLARNRAALKQLQDEAGGFTLDPGEVGRRVWRINNLRQQISGDEAALPDARQAAINADIANSQRRVNDELDAATAAATRYSVAVGELNKRLQESQNDPIGATNAGRFLSAGDYEREFRRLTEQRDKAVKAAREAERATAAPRVTSDFISPVSGARVSGQFGERRGNRDHAGVDLAVPVGTPVRAPAGGVVIESGQLGNYGNVVFIDHGGGTISRLAHLSRLQATKGQVVGQGDVIGLSGGARGAPGSGNSRGPHLHQEVLVNGRQVNPLGGRFATDKAAAAQKAERLAEAIRREAEELQNFGARAAESIARVNERFDEQPKLVDQASAATRQLDAVISDLSERQPPGFAQMIADAQRAKTVVTDALVRPFREMERDSSRRLQIQELITFGRREEADALNEIWRLEDRLGPLSEERKRQVYEIARAEDARGEALRRQQQLIGSYLDATRSIAQEIAGMFEGRSADFGAIFKRLNAEVLTEQLFGSMFQDLDRWVQRNTGLGRATDAFTTATETGGSAALNFAQTLDTASARIAAISANASVPDISIVPGSSLPLSAVDRALGDMRAANDNTPFDPNAEIVVTAKRALDVKAPANTVMAMTPELFARQVGLRVGDVLTSQLSGLLGTGLAGAIGRIGGGALSGSMIGGTPGAFLGGAQGLAGSLGLKGLEGILGKGVAGSGTGTLISGLGNALGLKMSGTGAQIGGAIGSFLPIPGGDIIGSIAGGLIGKLFGSPKWATSVASGGSASTRGNKGDWEGATGGAAGGVNDAIARMAEQFGAEIGDYAVSLGLNNGNWHVSTTGRSGRLRGNQGWSDVTDFKKDDAAALTYAIRDAISDGALQGLRAGTRVLLQKSGDLDEQIRKALDFESIFTRLREYKDPVGAAMDGLDKEFSRLRDIAITAGEGMVELEELYGIEREKVLKEASERVLGSLKALYDTLTVGDSGLSLRDREANARAAYEPLAERVAAGDRSAFDDYGAAAETLLDLSRQIYGSQEGYFAIFDEIRTLTKDTIGRETDLVALAADRDSPFQTSAVPANDNAAVVSAIQQMGFDVVGALNAQLSAVNDNLGAIIQQGLANGTITAPYNFQFPTAF